MRRLYLYVLVRLLRALAAAFAGAAGLFSIIGFNSLRRFAVRWGASTGAMAKALPVMVLQQLLFALPLACAAASTLVFSEMARSNELLAIESTGLDSRRLLRPLLPLGLALSLLAFGIEEIGWGWGMEQVGAIFLRDAAQSAERGFRSGQPVSPDGSGRYWMAAAGEEQDRAVFIGFSEAGVCEAFAGTLQRFYWNEEERALHMEIRDAEGFKKGTGSLTIEEADLSVGFEIPERPLPHGRDPFSRSLLDNVNALRHGTEGGRDRLRSTAAVHTNLGLILSPLAVLVLGAAFGVRVRFAGRGAAFGWSMFLVLLVFFPTWMATRGMIQGGWLIAATFPYLLDAVILLVGALLFRKWAGGAT